LLCIGAPIAIVPGGAATAGRRVLAAEVSRYSRMVKAARAIGVATA